MFQYKTERERQTERDTQRETERCRVTDRQTDRHFHACDKHLYTILSRTAV